LVSSIFLQIDYFHALFYSVFSGFLSSSAVQTMSDWVQKKTPSLFGWGSERSKTTVRINGHGSQRLGDGKNGGYTDNAKATYHE